MRFEFENHIHELTFSCFRRYGLLKDERFCKFLAESINLARDKYKFALLAYVFMPTHVHLLIYPNCENYSISSILKAIKQSTSRKAIRLLRKSDIGFLERLRTGQKHPPYRFWLDGPGYDCNIIFGKTLQKVVNYIHNNPLRANLVESPDGWKWSSFRDWEIIGEGPVPIDKDLFPVT